MQAPSSLPPSTAVTTARPIASHWFENLRIENILTGMALTCALSLAMQGLAHSNEAPAAQQPIPQQSAIQPAIQKTATPTVRASTLPDGDYLYGQAPQAEQLGATYLVFEVNKGNVKGAFYMPQSSFDCVHGRFQTQQLALTVVNSYEQASYPYTVALQPGSTTASATNPDVAPIALEGFHPIKQLSANDRRILSTCKASDRSI